MLRERLAWIPARGTLRVRLGGRRVELRTNWTDYVPTYIRPSVLRRRLGVRNAGAEPDGRPATDVQVEQAKRT